MGELRSRTGKMLSVCIVLFSEQLIIFLSKHEMAIAGHRPFDAQEVSLGSHTHSFRERSHRVSALNSESLFRACVCPSL
jgi:hypothetical protein